MGVLRFFFQAEDGIRDDLVTGVQTCALPILPSVPSCSSTHRRRSSGRSSRAARLWPTPEPSRRAAERRHSVAQSSSEEIGRASCREKRVDLGGRRIIKKKNVDER